MKNKAGKTSGCQESVWEKEARKSEIMTGDCIKRDLEIVEMNGEKEQQIKRI